MLLQSEIFILEEKYDLAINLLDISKNQILMMKKLLYKELVLLQKKGDHKLSIKYLHQALNFSDDPDEIWNLTWYGTFT